jgi:hypothetical protein
MSKPSKKLGASPALHRPPFPAAAAAGRTALLPGASGGATPAASGAAAWRVGSEDNGGAARELLDVGTAGGRGRLCSLRPRLLCS